MPDVALIHSSTEAANKKILHTHQRNSLCFTNFSVGIAVTGLGRFGGNNDVSQKFGRLSFRPLTPLSRLWKHSVGGKTTACLTTTKFMQCHATVCWYHANLISIYTAGSVYTILLPNIHRHFCNHTKQEMRFRLFSLFMCIDENSRDYRQTPHVCFANFHLATHWQHFPCFSALK